MTPNLSGLVLTGGGKAGGASILSRVGPFDKLRSIVLLACAPLLVAAVCIISYRLPREYAASTLIQARFHNPGDEISGPYKLIQGALQRLADSRTIDLEGIRDTDTFRITVYLREPQGAAQRANYLATTLELEPPSTLNIQMLQQAYPTRWPSKPHLALITWITLAFGLLICIAGAKVLSASFHPGASGQQP